MWGLHDGPVRERPSVRVHPRREVVGDAEVVGDGERVVAQPEVLDAGLDVRLAKQRLDVRREQVGDLQ